MIPPPSPSEITRLLRAAGKGDPQAADDVLPLIYDELKRLARQQLDELPTGQALCATRLVDEAFASLAGLDDDCRDRTHFMTLAARAMRRIVADFARDCNHRRAGNTRPTITLAETSAASGNRSADIADLDVALDQLMALSLRQCRIVELVYFSGLTIEETAAGMGISEVTVRREWRIARAWLRRHLSRGRST